MRANWAPAHLQEEDERGVIRDESQQVSGSRLSSLVTRLFPLTRAGFEPALLA